MKNRIAYLMIGKDITESLLFTDSRKVKKINDNNSYNVFIFKHTSDGYWDDIYELKIDDTEVKIKIFEDNDSTYSDLGCFIMENLAKAKWNSSISYPINGWHICSVCGCITNEIERCEYCDEWVCWDCAHNVANNEWDDNHYCSYICYRSYYAELNGKTYDPEVENKNNIINRINEILRWFDKEELINIILNIQNCSHLYNNLEELSEDELRDIIAHYPDDYIYNSLMELYEDETNNYLQDLLDAEAYINNLDPNDPADEWFFED